MVVQESRDGRSRSFVVPALSVAVAVTVSLISADTDEIYAFNTYR